MNVSDTGQVSLDALCDLVAVQRHPADTPEARYVGLEHVPSGRMRWGGVGKASDMQSHKFAFQRNDVLYGKLRPYLDKAVLADSDGLCTTELLVLRAKPGVSPRFLACVVHAPDFIAHAMAGVTGAHHPRTSWHHIANFGLPQYDLEAQRAIAALLWRVHDLVVSCEASTEAAKALKRLSMRELFSRGLRGEAQKETKIGPMPESWNPTPCEQIFKLTSGKTRPINLQRRPSAESSYPVLGGNGVMGYSDSWNVDAHAIMVIGRVGEYCGAVHYTSGKAWITDNALYTQEWRISEARPGFVGKFLEHYDLNRFKRMAGQPLVTQGMINEHSVPLPSPDEQRDIVTILDAIDRKIALHQRKRAVLEELFKALLHKLMTGEIAIDELDLSALEDAAAPEGALA